MYQCDQFRLRILPGHIVGVFHASSKRLHKCDRLHPDNCTKMVVSERKKMSGLLTAFVWLCAAVPRDGGSGGREWSDGRSDLPGVREPGRGHVLRHPSAAASAKLGQWSLRSVSEKKAHACCR